MATFSRNAYPKAMPIHSPDELDAQASKLSQLQEELSAQARRASQRDKELAEKTARLRRWTGRLVGAIVLAVLLTAGVVAYSLNRAGVAPASPAKEPASPVANFTPPLESAPPVAPKLAPLTLPANAQAKPSDGAANTKTDFLEALGSLSATHLYQSHLNIGLLADGVESETYTIADAEESLKPVIDMMKLVDVRLAKLAKSELDAEDRRSIQQIQTVSALLRLQIDALRAYWATGEMQQATDFQEARRASWQGVSKVMGLDR